MSPNKKVIKSSVISGGIILGYARVILPGDTEVPEIAVPVSKAADEMAALHKAIEETKMELRALRDSAAKKIGSPVAKIFDAQLMIVSDSEFLKDVNSKIKSEKRNAGFIYNKLIHDAVIPLKRSTDDYLRQTAVDIEAVRSRVLSHLTGFDKCDLKFPLNTILVGKRFTPGEILGFRQRKAIGFLVSEGGRNSHMALISRGLMLPVLLAKNIHLHIKDYSRLILDGLKGEIIVNPTDDDWREYLKLKKKQGSVSVTRIKKLTQIPPQTLDGKTIQVGANLTLPGPVDEILSDKNIPVGLYRTEFMYLSSGTFPTEQEQYEFYAGIAAQYKNSCVTMRTYDLGYDKIGNSDSWGYEENPALGWRGIRPMLEMTAIFKTQIRAILRASINKNMKIMLPMISDITELEKAKRLIRQVMFKLNKEQIPFDKDIKIGIMIEIPSAALTADLLAAKVDFMSIGTNDLTQYTLAVDRMNNKVAYLYSAFHPSVLNLIALTVKACKKHNIPISICGEVAGDLSALPLFIGMGVDMLSMNPGKIFDLCRLVKKIDSTMARHLTESVLKSDKLHDVIKNLQNYKIELEKKTISKRK